MKNIRDTCINYLKNEDIKRGIKDIIQPIRDIIYNELYVYVWFICIYNVILIFLVLIILLLLIFVFKNTRGFRDIITTEL